MITGTVTELHALVGVPFRIPGDQSIVIEFVVDTGFAGFLALPPDAVAALALPFSRVLFANLADDSDVIVAVHTATIIWDGQENQVDVIATGKRPLLGTLLLNGQHVDIQFTEGGSVSISPI